MFGKTLRQQVIDQSTHVLWNGVVVSAAFLSGAAWWGILLAGQWFWPRELVDQRPPGQRWPVRIGAGKWLDIAFFELPVLIVVGIRIGTGSA